LSFDIGAELAAPQPQWEEAKHPLDYDYTFSIHPQ